MEPRTLWNERLGVLIAGAGAGSALSYALGRTVFGPMMLQRMTPLDDVDTAPRRPVSSKAPNSDKTGRAGLQDRSRSWLLRAFDRLEAWSWERQVRQREAYLAQAQDLADLEHRMRQLDHNVLSRGRALS